MTVAKLVVVGALSVVFMAGASSEYETPEKASVSFLEGVTVTGSGGVE